MTLTITTYGRPHRESVLSLMFHSRRSHQHLDWYRLGQWLDSERLLGYLAHNADGDLMGAMALSQPLNRSSWVRMAVVHNRIDPKTVLLPLWERAADDLKSGEVDEVAVLVTNRWLSAYLPALGFKYLEDVITMQRMDNITPRLRPHRFSLRNAYEADLTAVTAIDHAAFKPPWQMSRDELRQSQRQAASYSVVETEGVIVGYQISTRHHATGHLARLGVLPDAQGQGVGAVLMDYLIERFNRRGVRSITVNTQASNIRSQRLYARYGFRRNGFDLPVWRTAL